MTPTNFPPEDTDRLRHHRFDGIQEFDKRLPNWWLMTLYGSILFWVGYWGYYQWLKAGPDGPQEITLAMSRIEAARLASAPTTDDPSLWKMSRNPVIVESGRATFNTTCASCHTDKLTGAIGPNLVDRLWIHGGKPAEIYVTVDKGVLAKGMPPWGPILGPKKVSEAVAYILSYHTEGEPIEVQAAWIPVLPK
jgi:cytochrome c oxidase cbb3-type subunit 3